ncbi:hypothetical protein MA9V1_220 [Chryseobacterium phage MA9V-1]|nr:hypothetical protein MA9V1_220 [Chryseobacterium phage MA9V-1]
MANDTFEWKTPAEALPKIGEVIIVELMPASGEPNSNVIRFNGQYVNVFSDNATFNHKNYFFDIDQKHDEKTFTVDKVKQWSPWFEGWETASVD